MSITTRSNSGKVSDPLEIEDEKYNTCPHCKKNVGTKGMQCNTCNYWFHCTCEGITDTEYKFFNTNSKTIRQIQWSCTTCTDGLQQLRSEVAQIGIRQLKLEKDFEALTEVSKKNVTAIEELNQKVKDLNGEEIGAVKKELKEAVGKVNDNINKFSKENRTSAVIDELRERQRRAKNIVVFNLPESTETEPEAKKADDEKAFKKICEDIVGHQSPEIEQVFRFGKSTNNRPRAMTVQLKGSREAEMILEHWTKIPLKTRKAKTQCVLIKDMTPEERDHLKALREEQKKMETDLEATGDTAHAIILTKDNKLVKLKKRAEVQNTE